MLPINIDTSAFIKAGEKENKRLEKEQKTKKTECSQQAIANQLVVGTMPSNPNAQPIEQAPVRQ